MHTIRLRGPWNYQVLHDADQPDVAADNLPSGKVTMPTDWNTSHGETFRGRVCYRRHFNRPTGLDTDSVVCLRVAAVDDAASLRLNEVDLGQVGNAAGNCFDITGVLNRSNRLELTLDLPPTENVSHDSPDPPTPTGGLICDVQLEIDANK